VSPKWDNVPNVVKLTEGSFKLSICCLFSQHDCPDIGGPCFVLVNGEENPEEAGVEDLPEDNLLLCWHAFCFELGSQ
jgi:hypothetical protein